MSKYLLKEAKRFRCDTEGEAEQLVEAFKEKNDVDSYEVKKKSTKTDEYFVVTVNLNFNTEKEPIFAYTEEI